MTDVVVETSVRITPDQIIAALEFEDFCELVCAISEKFDQNFAQRAKLAKVMEEHMSEKSVRFLAEVVTSFYQRSQP